MWWICEMKVERKDGFIPTERKTMDWCKKDKKGQEKERCMFMD